MCIPCGKTSLCHQDQGHLSRSGSHIKITFYTKTLGLAKTFDWLLIELSYFKCVYLGVTPFLWHQGQGHVLKSNIKATIFKHGSCGGIHVSQIHVFCVFVQVTEEIWICEKETITKWEGDIYKYKGELVKLMKKENERILKERNK